MQSLFSGKPEPLPEHVGPSWTVGSGDRPAAPIRHAAGYEPFVEFAAKFGTDARSLFDLWAFAHFLRAHSVRFDEDSDLRHAAVVFLGNVLIVNQPECFWTNKAPGLAVESEPGPLLEVGPGVFQETGAHRYLGVDGTIPALLAADEERFLEFQTVVDDWMPRATPPVRRPLATRPEQPGAR